MTLPAVVKRSEQLSPQSKQEQRAWLGQHVQRLSLEKRQRHALAKADATLHSFSEVTAPDSSLRQLVVEWSEQGHTYHYRSAIDPGLTVVSSGICLSGRDHDFDLTSLVHVMGQGPSFARYDEE